MNDESGTRKNWKLKPRQAVPAEQETETLCPNCQHPLPSTAIFCIHCGYNLNTGKLLKPKKGNAAKIFSFLLVAIIFAGLLIAGIIAFKQSSDFSEKAKGIYSDTVDVVQDKVEDIKNEFDITSTVTTEDDTEASFESPADVSDESIKSSPDQQLEDAPETPKAPIENKPKEEARKKESVPPPSALSAEDIKMAKNLTDRFNKKYPLFESGQIIKLRTTKNTMITGRLVYVVREYFLIEDEKGARRKIQFNTLHKVSRVQVDPQYRKSYLKKIIQQKLKEKGNQ